MTERSEGAMQGFDVQLFIVHPTMDPTDIATALGLDGHFVHRVGDIRKTPKGTVLQGTYPDTRWRHCVRHNLEGQWFAKQITEFVDRLAPHKEFFGGVRSTGGKACIILQFLGDRYFGDDVPIETLAKLVDLELDFAIECFVDPQSGRGPHEHG